MSVRRVTWRRRVGLVVTSGGLLLGLAGVTAPGARANTCWSGAAGSGCAPTPRWGNEICAGNQPTGSSGLRICSQFIIGDLPPLPAVGN